MHPKPVHLLALTLLIAAQAALQAIPQEGAERFLHLRYAASHQQSKEGENVSLRRPLPGKSSTRIDITIAARAIQVEEAGHTTLYDFERARILHLDREHRTYRESSLLALLADRNRELFKRLGMARIMKKSGLQKKMPALHRFEIQNLFGLARGKGPPVEVESREAEGLLSFSHAGEVVASCRFGERHLDQAETEMFRRFLFYRGHLHPKIREGILERHLVPSLLSYRYRNIGVRHEVELRLLEAIEDGNGPVAVGSWRRSFDADDPLENLVRRALVPTARARRARLQRAGFLDLAAKAVATGHFEDAALALVECGVQTGHQPLRQLMAIAKDPVGVQRVKPVFEAMQLVNEDPKKALTLLASIDRKHLARPHVLDVFRADALAGAERTDEARALFLKVLAGHPFLSGVYKDLGDLYHGESEMQKAWLCWNTGRALVGDHPLFAEIEKYEGALRVEFAGEL